jgi:quercetin dioxygenase-like cupin family protein
MKTVSLCKKHKLCAISLGLGMLLTLGASKADNVPGVQKEVLSQSTSSWDGTAYAAYPSGAPELTVLKITIPAHASLPWHTHPIPNAAYVVSGELTVEKKDTGEKRILTAGQVLPELVGQLHRGTSGDAPVVLIVFYAGAKGVPLAQ